ncbi:angiopoietin-related protein 5-like [Thalassophryne amazonica]|uniref:angiopoietin-related protein 5-like n=1 Tax=Thalassophryne amazonica TaxID=390379 RepID=UPI001471C85A|nr:angiopoietin-related protein 5-like [Thalassophryne amazonica]
MRSFAGICGLIFICFLSRSVQNPGASQGTDCSEIQRRSPQAKSGIYTIQPAGLKKPVKVHCEMYPDGGWTVFQYRSGSSVPFNRTWCDYKNGFGAPPQDYWLGLMAVHLMTNNNNRKWTLRVDLRDHEGGMAYAEYRNFRLDNEKNAFKLHVGAYQGTAGNAIRGSYAGIDQNGFGFSTVGHDNDGCDPCIFGDIAVNECVFSEGGGWWFSRCGSANLNGEWHPTGDHIGWASGLHWRTWKGPAPYSAKSTRMMIKSE